MSKNLDGKRNETCLCYPAAAGIRKDSQHNLAVLEEGETTDIQIHIDPDGHRIRKRSPEEHQKEHYRRDLMVGLRREDEPMSLLVD